MRQDLDDRSSRRSDGVSTLLAGERLADAVGSCARAANASVPSASASTAASIARGVVAASRGSRAARRAARRCRARSSASSRSPSASSAALRRQQHALGLDLRLAQRARLHVGLGGREALLQHAARSRRRTGRSDGLTSIDASTPERLLARATPQQAVGVDLEGHADARRAGRHRRDAAQLEARQRAAVGDQLALALHHVDRHRGLAVLEGGEVLRRARRDGRVARDDALDQAAHGLDAERQRDHVEQQPVVAAARCCRPAVGLDRGAERDDLVGVRGWSAAAGRRTRRPRARTCGMRVAPPTSTTPLTSSCVELGVAQRLAHRGHASLRSGRCVIALEVGARHAHVRRPAVRASTATVARLGVDSSSLASRAAI